MKLTTISILIALVALFEIARTVSRIKRDRIGIRSGVLWACMWSAIGYFALFPSHLDHGLELAQMENRMFFITVLALLLLFAIVFAQASQIERLRRDGARMVQELALARARAHLRRPTRADPAEPASTPAAASTSGAARSRPSSGDTAGDLPTASVDA